MTKHDAKILAFKKAVAALNGCQGTEIFAADEDNLSWEDQNKCFKALQELTDALERRVGKMKGFTEFNPYTGLNFIK